MINQITDAVLQEFLNNSWSLSFTPEKSFRPVYDLGELETLQVSIVFREYSKTIITRGDNDNIVSVDVGVMRKIQSDLDNENLIALCQEIMDFFLFKRINSPDGICIQTVLQHVPEHISEYRQFSGIIRLNFRVIE